MRRPYIGDGIDREIQTYSILHFHTSPNLGDIDAGHAARYANANSCEGIPMIVTGYLHGL